MPDIIVFALQEVVSLNPVNIAVGSTFMVRKREGGGEERGGEGRGDGSWRLTASSRPGVV